MKLSLRAHQLEGLNRAKNQNTIICLPTGEGKTLIAARLIEHYLELHPELKVAFLVPTRALVDQQSKYCVDHCSLPQGIPPVVQTMIGDDQAAWGQRDWEESFNLSQIFLGTPAVFQQALVTDKYISVDRFSLIVFDEVHNAKGNSPMAGVMRDGVAPFYLANGHDLPRILGLTASPIHGKMSHDKVQKRQALEALMNSTIFCPVLPSRLDSSNFSRVNFSQDQFHKEHADTVQELVTESLESTRLVKDIPKLARKCVHVFSELGASSLLYYVENVIVQQIQDKATNLELQQEAIAVAFARKLRQLIPKLDETLRRLKERLLVALPSSGGAQSPKLRKLLELLRQNFASNTAYRGIVFCEQIALVSCLCKEINDALAPIRCGAVAGVKAQREVDREEQIQAFKNGATQLLVATASLEEGIDVPDCKLVVRFNSIATTTGHIQGAGRARHDNADIYYFENCPESELNKERDMVALAQNVSLGLSLEELKKKSAAMVASAHERHPYPFYPSSTSGQVNVFNCKQIFVQYCSRVLSQSISPKEHLYDYNDHDVLLSIRYPTPDGWKSKSLLEYDRFWYGVDMTKIFPIERSQNTRTADRREMRFVYLVVIDLRENQWLDAHNKPLTAELTKRKCSLQNVNGMVAGVLLRDKVVQGGGTTPRIIENLRGNYEHAFSNDHHVVNDDSTPNTMAPDDVQTTSSREDMGDSPSSNTYIVWHPPNNDRDNRDITLQATRQLQGQVVLRQNTPYES